MITAKTESGDDEGACSLGHRAKCEYTLSQHLLCKYCFRAKSLLKQSSSLLNRFSSEEIDLLKKEFGISSDSRLKAKAESMSDYDLDVLLHRLKNPAKPAYPDYQKPLDTKKPPTTPTVPYVPKPPADLPEIIKPSQQGPNRITDTGTGGLSEFQAAKNTKHISGVDYNYLISYFNGNVPKAQDAVISLKEDELREMIDAQKGLAGYVRSQLSGSETDFNPFDGATFIIGAGGNIVPGAGVSGDVDILMDLKGNVAVVRSGAVDYGLPAVSGGGRLGFSTADNVKDLYGTFIHGGASGGELGVFGVEASGSTSEGKLKNASLVGQVNVGGGSPFEVHGGAGNTEVIWEGTQKEFWEIVGNSIKDTWESIGEYPEDWPLDNYNGGFS